MIRVDFPPRRRVDPSCPDRINLRFNPLNQAFVGRKSPIRQAPEYRLRIARQCCSCARFRLASPGISAHFRFLDTKGSIRCHHNPNPIPMNDVARQSAEATKHLIIRVGRKNQRTANTDTLNSSVGHVAGL